MRSKLNTRILIALATLYLSWSSTYLAIRIALESFPPFFTAGFRYLLVGAGMYIYLRRRSVASPSIRQWAAAALTGAFLLLGGTGGVVYAEQWVGSGVAALVIATTPLWTVLFAGIWKQWPQRNEWLGLILGFLGIVLLNLEGDLRAYPLGAAILVLAAASWSFGSMLSLRLPMPKGMMSSAAQMLTGGLIVLLIGFSAGEHVPTHPSVRAVGALIYLAVFGSLLGYTAYTYLLKNVTPALATSYSYVNPVLAVLLGAWIGKETISVSAIAAMLIILAGVVLVLWGQLRRRPASYD